MTIYSHIQHGILCLQYSFMYNGMIYPATPRVVGKIPPDNDHGQITAQKIELASGTLLAILATKILKFRG